MGSPDRGMASKGLAPRSAPRLCEGVPSLARGGAATKPIETNRNQSDQLNVASECATNARRVGEFDGRCETRLDGELGSWAAGLFAELMVAGLTV